jgi:hypothetical protein
MLTIEMPAWAQIRYAVRLAHLLLTSEIGFLCKASFDIFTAGPEVESLTVAS